MDIRELIKKIEIAEINITHFRQTTTLLLFEQSRVNVALDALNAVKATLTQEMVARSAATQQLTQPTQSPP